MKTLVTLLDDEGKLVAQQLTEASPHSIEVSRTTRGYTWTIKKYFGEQPPEVTVNEILALDKILKERFLTNDPSTAMEEFLDEAVSGKKKK